MKSVILKSIAVVSILFTTMVSASSNLPTQEPMGGKPFGHSVKK